MESPTGLAKREPEIQRLPSLRKRTLSNEQQETQERLLRHIDTSEVEERLLTHYGFIGVAFDEDAEPAPPQEESKIVLTDKD